MRPNSTRCTKSMAPKTTARRQDAVERSRRSITPNMSKEPRPASSNPVRRPNPWNQSGRASLSPLSRPHRDFDFAVLKQRRLTPLARRRRCSLCEQGLIRGTPPGTKSIPSLGPARENQAGHRFETVDRCKRDANPPPASTLISERSRGSGLHRSGIL